MGDVEDALVDSHASLAEEMGGNRVEAEAEAREWVRQIKETAWDEGYGGGSDDASDYNFERFTKNPYHEEVVE